MDIEEFNDDSDTLEGTAVRWNDDDIDNDGNIVSFWGSNKDDTVAFGGGDVSGDIGCDASGGGTDNDVDDDKVGDAADDDNNTGAEDADDGGVGDAAPNDADNVDAGDGCGDAAANDVDAAAACDADSGACDADVGAPADVDNDDAFSDANGAEAGVVVAANDAASDDGAPDDADDAPNEAEADAVDTAAANNVVDSACGVAPKDADVGAGDTSNDDDDPGDTAAGNDADATDELDDIGVIAMGNRVAFVWSTVLKLLGDALVSGMVLWLDGAIIVRFFKIYSTPCHSSLWITNTFPTGQVKLATVSSGIKVSLTVIKNNYQ